MFPNIREMRQVKCMTQIKICGITRPEETEYLNQNQVDYAGFVFFEKSKRNVSISQAKKLMNLLDKNVKRTAVTVSPDEELVQSIEQAGFDILQVHGELKESIRKTCKLPIWRAVNIQSIREAKKQLEWEKAFINPQLAGYVVDGASYGSGKTFCWEEIKENEFSDLLQKIKEKTFVLAGGLKAQNVSEGIRIFSPDVVDVSSGVEGKDGKEKEKIEEFVKEVRKYG